MPYSEAFGLDDELPSSLQELEELTIGKAISDSIGSAEVRRTLRRPTLSLLYNNVFKAAAIDLESRVTEAALRNLHTADFRNFAHGRHHWMARRGQQTGVIALVDTRGRELADRTLALLPTHVPITRWDVGGTRLQSALTALLLSLHLTRSLGECEGVDPGRPGVPDFGRKLYHLRAGWKPYARSQDSIDVAVQRKQGRPTQLAKAQSHSLGEAFRNYHQKLVAQEYDAIVFDFDGTLCDPHDRYDGLTEEIANALIRLLEQGLPIAVVTGRGGSARRALQQAIPTKLWADVIVGYYNGGDWGPLSDDQKPNGQGNDSRLHEIALSLAESYLAETAKIEERKYQITLSGHNRIVDLREAVEEHLALRGFEGVRVVRSSHSVDVIRTSTRKTSVFDQLNSEFGLKGPYLCIGDRGKWPGNDAELLGRESGLSVEEVSQDPGVCWNLAPAGQRGIQATLFYLSAVSVSKNRRCRITL